MPSLLSLSVSCGAVKCFFFLSISFSCVCVSFLPVVLSLEEAELLLDPVDGLPDRQLERSRLRGLNKK